MKIKFARGQQHVQIGVSGFRRAINGRPLGLRLVQCFSYTVDVTKLLLKCVFFADDANVFCSGKNSK